jgi:hypothetical protein
MSFESSRTVESSSEKSLMNASLKHPMTNRFPSMTNREPQFHRINSKSRQSSFIMMNRLSQSTNCTPRNTDRNVPDYVGLWRFLGPLVLCRDVRQALSGQEPVIGEDFIVCAWSEHVRYKSCRNPTPDTVSVSGSPDDHVGCLRVYCGSEYGVLARARLKLW